MTPAEKNKRVAEILGYGIVGDKMELPLIRMLLPIPNYCGNIEAAMGLVDYMIEQGYVPDMLFDFSTKEYEFSFRHISDEPDLFAFAFHQKLCLAIVNAFLRANGVEA